MNIVVLTNSSELAKYFVNKLSLSINIKNVFVEIKSIKLSKKKQLIRKILGDKALSFLLKIKRSISGKKSKVYELDEKLEEEKKYQYFDDYNNTINMKQLNFININLTQQEGIHKLKNENIDLLILFGTSIIKEDVLSIPKIGTINFHSSLLPYYKGSRVEFWQLYYDDIEYCGSTVHFVDKGVDTGDIIVQEKIDVDKKDIFWDLRYKNIIKGLELIPKAIEIITNNQPTKKTNNYKSRSI